MVVPSWQEIIDDVLEVLTFKESLEPNNQLTAKNNPKDETAEDMLDVLLIHKFQCGHSIKVPKHRYDLEGQDFPKLCKDCSEKK